MKRERISRALSDISMEYIAECESYAPKRLSGKERKMGHYEQVTKPAGRKIAVLILAACLIMALGISAYATGFLPSLVAQWARGRYYQTPTDELREEQPDYAAWLDEQLEIRATLEEMGENSRQVNEEKIPEGLADGSITLLESYYDGEKFTMACRLETPQWPVTFDFDESSPLFADLHGPEEGYWSDWEAWEYHVPLEADQEQIRKALEADGHVGFATYEFFLSDHVLVNDEDPGFSHSDPDDNDGIFYVDPFYTSVYGSELPESCRNLPELNVTFNLRCCIDYYWLDGDTVQWTFGDRIDYPVSFTIPNINP